MIIVATRLKTKQESPSSLLNPGGINSEIVTSMVTEPGRRNLVRSECSCSAGDCPGAGCGRKTAAANYVKVKYFSRLANRGHHGKNRKRIQRANG